MTRRKKRVLFVLLGLVLVFISLHVFTPRVKIQVGPDTTVIDGPLNDDGTVNYVAYLNAKSSEGVTPENNAAPLLVRALGRPMLPPDAKLREELLNWLGLSDFDPTSEFEKWSDYVDRVSKLGETTSPASAPGSTPGPTDWDEVWELVRGGHVPPGMKPWLEQNAQALDMVVEASRRSRLYLPLLGRGSPPDLLSAEIPRLGAVRGAGRALAMRAIIRWQEGDQKGAWEDVLAVHRLANLAGQGPTLVHQLVAIAVDYTAAQAGIQMATDSRFGPEPADGVAATLLHRAAVSDVVGSMDRSERYMELDIVTILSRPGNKSLKQEFELPVDPSEVDWNEVLRLHNANVDRRIKGMRLPRFGGREKASQEYSEYLDRQSRHGQDVGKAHIYALKLGGWPCREALSREVYRGILPILTPTLAKALSTEDSCRMEASVETSAVALALFKAKTGHWPEKLEELVPQYLPALPADAFSTRPLVYRRAADGYVLYSIGQNCRDDGGVHKGEAFGVGNPDADDIVARVGQAATQPTASQPAGDK